MSSPPLPSAGEEERLAAPPFACSLLEGSVQISHEQ